MPLKPYGEGSSKMGVYQKGQQLTQKVLSKIQTRQVKGRTNLHGEIEEGKRSGRGAVVLRAEPAVRAKRPERKREKQRGKEDWGKRSRWGAGSA